MEQRGGAGAHAQHIVTRAWDGRASMAEQVRPRVCVCVITDNVWVRCVLLFCVKKSVSSINSFLDFHRRLIASDGVAVSRDARHANYNRLREGPKSGSCSYAHLGSLEFLLAHQAALRSCLGFLEHGLLGLLRVQVIEHRAVSQLLRSTCLELSDKGRACEIAKAARNARRGAYEVQLLSRAEKTEKQTQT